MTILLVGGSPSQCSAELLRDLADRCDVVVAVDRGLDPLLSANVNVDLFCGDADSVGEQGRKIIDSISNSPGSAHSFEIERYNPHKDYTDLDLALKAIESRWGHRDILACCLEGGNPDHFLAVMGRLIGWQGDIELVHDGRIGRILKSGQSWCLDEYQGSRFSFVPLSNVAVVSECRMRWELDHKRAPLLSDLGISNELDHPDGSITCHEGVIAAWVFSK